MSQEFLNNITLLFSFFFGGVSIKMLDDCIDENKTEFIPYILCFLCISVGLWKSNASLFLSSYIVGMYHDMNLKLISRLKAYQEQLLIFIISILLCGLNSTISSLLVITAIQLLDDLIDEKTDLYTGKKNWSILLGRVESIIILLLIITVSVYFYPYKTIICVILALLISSVFNWYGKSYPFKEKT